MVIHGAANLYRLIELVVRRHDDQDIHIAIRMRLAISVGTKQDDLLGLKPLGNLAGEVAD
jgi:hypothetical protein